MSKTDITVNADQPGQNTPTVLFESDNCILMRLDTAADCLWAANDANAYEGRGGTSDKWCTRQEIVAEGYLKIGPLLYSVDEIGRYVWQICLWGHGNKSVNKQFELENQYRDATHPLTVLRDASINPGMAADWKVICSILQDEIALQIPCLAKEYAVNALNNLLDIGVENMSRQNIDIINRQLWRLSGLSDPSITKCVKDVIDALSSQMDEVQTAYAHNTLALLAPEAPESQSSSPRKRRRKTPQNG